jgi:hypothetical protein
VLPIRTNGFRYVEDPKIIRAGTYVPKDGSKPGDRIRVFWDEVDAIHRMMARGWSRHLPIELGAMFFVVAMQAHSGITGDLMWFNIRELFPKVVAEGFPGFTKEKRVEVAERFAREYGKPHATTVEGAIEDLIDLGLLERYQGKGEGLRVPVTLPSPDKRLTLTESELKLLRERQKLG